MPPTSSAEPWPSTARSTRSSESWGDYRDPEVLKFGEPPATWLALTPDFEDYGGRGAYAMRVIARIEHGGRLVAAAAALREIGRELSAAYPEDNRVGENAMELKLVPLKQDVVGNSGTPILVLLGAVALLLVVASANVGNLFLVRGSQRLGELQLRSALGATPRRLVQQLVAEASVVSLAASAAGILVARGGVLLFRGIGPAHLPRLQDAAVDSRALALALAIAVLSAVAFGLAPLLQLPRAGGGALRSGARVSDSGRAKRLRGALVVGEIALALVLLSGAGLLVRSFAKALRTDPGFDPEHVMVLEVRSAPHLLDALLERARGLPGVTRAALGAAPASSGGEWTRFTVRGREGAFDPARFDRINAVSDDYFRSLGVELVDGRDFGPGDTKESAPVAIVNEVAVRKYWGGENPIGRYFKRGAPDGDHPWVEVVGVVADVRQRAPNREPEAEFYFPRPQAAPGRTTLVVQYQGNDDAMAAALRGIVAEADSDLPIDRLLTLRERVDGTLVEPRFYAALLAAFAALALVVAAVGVYGNVAFNVSRELKGLGIRIAFGARRKDILRLILESGARTIAAGLALGLTGALLLARALEGLVFGMSPTDPATLAAAAALLGAIGLLACAVPARRASRVDPNRLLRAE